MHKLFLNSRVVDAARARIDPSDGGLLHGIGLFETLRAYRGVPFRLDRHVARMLASARALSLPLRHTAEQIARAVRAVIRANRLNEARVRITATRGPVRLSDSGEPAEPESTLLVTATGDVGYPQDYYQRGMAVAIAAVRLNPTDPTVPHKTLAYWSRLLTLRAAQSAGCGEALWFTPDGHLAEGCISNVFLVKDGRLATPPLDTPVLPGITRATVLELAAADNIQAEQRPLTHAELLAAEEVFLTNAIMEVMPVVRVERHRIADGRPGPVTRALAELYRRLVEKETGS